MMPLVSNRPAAAKIRARVERAAFSAANSWFSSDSRSAVASGSSLKRRSRAGATWKIGTIHRAIAARIPSSTRAMTARLGRRRRCCLCPAATVCVSNAAATEEGVAALDRATNDLLWHWDPVGDLPLGVLLEHLAARVEQLDVGESFGHRQAPFEPRSEERRVGKEGRSRW